MVPEAELEPAHPQRRRILTLYVPGAFSKALYDERYPPQWSDILQDLDYEMSVPDTISQEPIKRNEIATSTSVTDGNGVNKACWE